MIHCKTCGATTLPAYDEDGDECVFCEIKQLRQAIVLTADDEMVTLLREATIEIIRMRHALRSIANGNISPSIDFARRVLDGEDPSEALKAELQ